MTGKLLAGSILDDQIRLENNAVENGVRRYRRLIRDAIERDSGAALKPAERLLLHWLRPLEAAIKTHKRSVRSGKAGIGAATYGSILLLAPADRMAVAAIRAVLSACMAQPGGVDVARIAYIIGRDIVAEINMDMIRRDYREGIKELNHKFRSFTTAGVNWWANKSMDDPIWNRKVCSHLGVRILWLLISTASCGPYTEDDGNWEQAFHHQKRPTKQPGRFKAIIKMDRRAFEIIDSGHAWRQYMRPRYLPMIVAPYPWEPKNQGGYVRIRTPFISKPSPSQKKALQDADLTQIHECLNAVNATAWRINRRVYDVIQFFWNDGGGLIGIPLRDRIPLPPQPYGFHTDEAVKKQWKLEAARTHERNVHLQGERQQFISTLDVAEQMLDEPAFYLPHQLDFRGRAYPIPVHLNHQGDDICRGLLEFAQPRKPGERGIYWLKIHVANCYGYDKASFADRAAWADSNMGLILNVAAEPVQMFNWWRLRPDGRPRKEAFQLLAACFALADPEGAGAHLPVGLDGTCNGLQHYAAIGRDTQGGAAVNLCPSDCPADIYQRVADIIRPRVIEEAEIGTPEALMIVDHLSRDLVKQPVMTSVYGVTMVGARQQVLKKLLDLDLPRNGDDREHEAALYKASMYLSSIVLDAIKQACPGATACMDWLRQAARAVAGPPVEKQVEWITPLGLPVIQSYRRWKTVQINTVLQQLSLMVDDENVPVKTGKQINGFAPNFVHSLDATHMFMTARAMHRHGLAFAAVHDSYWTHAGDVDAMARTLREQFVTLHRQPLLVDLKRQLETQYKVELPDPPEPGNLNLDAVLASDYFFS